MNSVILRTLAPFLVSLMLIYSVYVLFRGHNEPGGGFIGALIATSGFALYSIVTGPHDLRRALVVDPLAISGLGVVLAALSGAPSWFAGVPFLTGLWSFPDIGIGVKIPAGTPVLFDIGVYLSVVGALVAIILALEEDEH